MWWMLLRSNCLRAILRQCCAYLVLHDWPTLTEERLTEIAEFEAFKEAA